MVRLKDIAQYAHVSVMTVSKALRDAPDVSAATKARIKQLAQQMGYVPDSTAQGLRTRTTRIIGLLIPATTDPIYARMVLGIEERAHELGYDLMLMHTRNNLEREEACIRRLLSRRIDGLLVAPVYRMEPESRIYQELLARRTPTILLGPSARFCAAFPSVQVDDVLGAYLGTQHLLQLGHRRIAFLGGPLAAPWAQDRFQGYRRALRESGSDVDEKLVFQAGGTVEDGVKAALQMLNESCGATAVQTANDLVAIGCSNALLNQGVRIPQDLSVVGFGNVLASEYFRVPLTTVRQPKFRLGLAGLDMLMQAIRGERVESKRMPPELVIRNSSTEPASSKA
ncbi:MAG TPA: LacI family DNA-binding transcriptional regulator [Verrucomicrobiae bacterium]|nr:LacI family DNA-binding transcriptional regulator [Verrucomicrobiae bacterium]